MNSYKIIDHEYDVVVLGAGGSSLKAAVSLSEAGLKTRVFQRIFPTKSHTSAAQVFQQHWETWVKMITEWHMYDTVKDLTGWVIKDAIEHLCKEAPKAVIELRKVQCPF